MGINIQLENKLVTEARRELNTQLKGRATANCKEVAEGVKVHVSNSAFHGLDADSRLGLLVGLGDEELCTHLSDTLPL